MGKAAVRTVVRYSEELKSAVVRAVEKEGMSVVKASHHFKVPERNIYTWRHKYGKLKAEPTKVVQLTVKSESDKIRQLEGLVSELSIQCRVLREKVKIYEETYGAEGKKKLTMKQLEELERLKKEAEELLGG